MTDYYHVKYPLEQRGLLIVDANGVLVGDFRMHRTPSSAFESWTPNPQPNVDEIESLVSYIVHVVNQEPEKGRLAKLLTKPLDTASEIGYNRGDAE